MKPPDKFTIERLLIEYSHINERRHEILIKMQETKMLRENTENTLKSAFLDGMPKVKQLTDQVYKAVQKVVDEYDVYLRYYKSEIEELNRKEIAMHEALKVLEPHEYNIIQYRYIKGYDWRNVILKVHYNRSRCFEIRDMSLEKLINVYKNSD